MSQSATQHSLLARVRAAFLLVCLLMLLLLGFQLYKTGAFIQQEVQREQAVAQQALHAWLISELKQLDYTRRGLQTYKYALAGYVENGQTSAILAALAQIRQTFNLTHVVFVSAEGEGWSAHGATAQQVPRLPPMEKLPENLSRLWHLSSAYQLPFWREVFASSGLYGVVRIPIDYEIGDYAGTLWVFKQLLRPKQAAGFFNVMLRDSQASFFLSPPDSLVEADHSIWALLQQAWAHAPLQFWLPLPAYVLQRDTAGLVVQRQAHALYDMMWESLLVAVLPFLLFAGMLLILYWGLKREIVLPLMSMAEAFVQLRKGEREVSIPLGRAVEEVAYVIKQTNHMIEAQARMTAKLEEQVAVRTQALERANTELKRLAFTDALTQVNNRVKFQQSWQEKFASGAHGGVGVALVNIDLFRDINEAYGVEVGNQILRQMAQVLQEMLGSAVQVYRVGGDEFLLLFSAPDYESDMIQPQLEALVELLARQPQEKQALPMALAVSIGWLWLPAGKACSEPELLRRLQAALQRAKEGLTDKVQRFDPTLDAATQKKVADFDQARHVRALVEKGEGLLLYGQPLVDAQQGQTRYVEVLARMQGQQGEPLAPGVFFPLIAHLRLKVDFDRRVIEQVAAQLARKVCDSQGVSINLSPETLKHPSLFEWLKPLASACAQYKIVLEITENTLMEDLRAMRVRLEKLRGMGFKVAIDDFGSEYSSIAYLAHLDADIVKFDMSLARTAFEDARSRQIILGLAQQLAELEYEVVFEGIETQEMAEFFKRPFIHYLQGYYFSPPAPCPHHCDR